jgi:hypothetical protein
LIWSHLNGRSWHPISIGLPEPDDSTARLPMHSVVSLLLTVSVRVIYALARSQVQRRSIAPSAPVRLIPLSRGLSWIEALFGYIGIRVYAVSNQDHR